MKTFLIGLLLFCTTSFVGNAQIVKLKSSKGFVQTDDYVKLHYQLLGEGSDTLVVVHGGGTFGSAYLVPDLTPLAAHHKLLFYDQAGAGYSTVVKDTTRYSMNNTIKDIEEIRKHFKLKKLNLLCHSTGGLICGYYATTYPDKVKSMMLIAPLPAAAAMTNGWVNKNDSLTALLLEQNKKIYENKPVDSTKACWDYYSLWIRGFAASYAEARNIWGNICNCNQANLTSPFSYYKMKSIGNWDITSQLANVKARVLILAGDNDAIPFASFEHWNNSLPNSSLLNFKGAGHLPNADEPTAFFLAIETFLKGNTPDESVMDAFGAGVILPDDLKESSYLRARAAVIEVENELVRLANRSEWEGMSKLYTSDGIIYPPGAPPIIGRNAIATFWKTVSKRGMHSLQLHLVDLEISGDLLIANGKYSMRNEQNEILDIGKFIAIYRNENNKWYLQTDMFNSSLETRSPLEVPDYLTILKE
ncbi:alpha/beta fold hydrolase [Lutimonas vermicola]|uniref:Alpha/beta fold hydrolase n=1 Tax=Lutimonas vermicola TaxID=414288 RepID=A0ABU9L241_9FLAO